MTSIGVAIVSWPGFEENALHIFSELQGQADVVHVLHNGLNSYPNRLGDSWIDFPEDSYFGRKFAWAISNIDADITLFIVADTRFGDWGKLLRQCKQAFSADSSIAIWAPVISETWWNMERIRISNTARNDDLLEVIAVDSIVWALSSEVIGELRSLDYSKSRFGWGIEVSSAAVARCRGKSIVCDPEVHVEHRRGTTYSTEIAMVEAEDFYSQLSPVRRSMVSLIEEFALLKTVSTPMTVTLRIRRVWGYARDLVYRLTIKRLRQKDRSR